MQAAMQRWMAFWFAPSDPFNLGAARALFYGALFLIYLRADFRGWSEVSLAFWMPTWPFATAHLPVLSDPVLAVLQGAWKTALLTSAVGLFTRASTTAAFVLGFYLLGLGHNFGKVHHVDAALVIAMGITAASYCGHAVSLDSLRSGTRRAPSGEYTWPIRAVWMTMALVFFAAGVSKLRRSGLDWVLTTNLSTAITQIAYETSTSAGRATLGTMLAQHEWLCRVLAGITLAAEVGYPLALVSSRARVIIVPAMIAIQIGIRFFMSIAFDQFMLLNAFWVPWDRVLALAQRLLARTSRADVAT